MKCFSERARHRPDEGVGDGGPFGRLYPLMVSSGHKRAALLATPPLRLCRSPACGLDIPATMLALADEAIE
jgi:hypothetical protein